MRNTTTVANSMDSTVASQKLHKTSAKILWLPSVMVASVMVCLLAISFARHIRRVQKKKRIIGDYVSLQLHVRRCRISANLCNTYSIPLRQLASSVRMLVVEEPDGQMKTVRRPSLPQGRDALTMRGRFKARGIRHASSELESFEEESYFSDTDGWVKIRLDMLCEKCKYQVMKPKFYISEDNQSSVLCEGVQMVDETSGSIYSPSVRRQNTSRSASVQESQGSHHLQSMTSEDEPYVISGRSYFVPRVPTVTVTDMSDIEPESFHHDTISLDSFGRSTDSVSPYWSRLARTKVLLSADDNTDLTERSRDEATFGTISDQQMNGFQKEPPKRYKEFWKTFLKRKKRKSPKKSKKPVLTKQDRIVPAADFYSKNIDTTASQHDVQTIELEQRRKVFSHKGNEDTLNSYIDEDSCAKKESNDDPSLPTNGGNGSVDLGKITLDLNPQLPQCTPLLKQIQTPEEARLPLFHVNDHYVTQSCDGVMQTSERSPMLSPTTSLRPWSFIRQASLGAHGQRESPRKVTRRSLFASPSTPPDSKAIHNGLQSIMNFPKESRLPEEYREPCSPNSRLLSYSYPEKRVYSLGERFVEVVPTKREKLVTLIQSSMKDFVPARQRWINFEYRSISDSLLVHQNHQATSCMGSVVLTPESCCSKTGTAEEESWQSKLAEYVEPIRFPSWILAQAARVNRTLRNKSTHVSLLSSSGERVSKRKLNINVDTQDEEQKPTLYRDENQYEMNRKNGEENSGLYKDETEKITTELDLGTVCLPRTTKKRPRPRLSSFQSDKKMWMMSKAATSESEQPQVPQIQSEQPRQAKSNKDIIISAFGFDPTVDPFSRYKRSSVALPSSLASLQLPTLNRSDVCFFRDDEDEFIVYKSGASTTLFKAVYNVTNVLVKDVFRSHGQQILIEAKILYMLNNTGLTPNVHGVIRQGVVEEEFSVVMQHLDGYLSLKEILLSGLFVSRRSWCSIVKTLASHLHVLHEHRVIHNNLNQEHVLVNPDTLDVKVVGFGNASFLQGRKLNVSGLANNNMAPEMQFGCVSSPHSDVFAFGNIVQAVMNESKVMSLYNVVQACLQKLPRDRPLTEIILSIVTTL